MSVFVDTSAFLIMLNGSDAEHIVALTAWNDVVRQGRPLVSTNYVVVETVALVQRRLGMTAVQLLLDRLLPAIEIKWVEPGLHAEATLALRTANLRDLSLVDCVSFAVMRQLGISEAIAFDHHFDDQGFTCLR
jgi:uncharacterized protein